MNRGNFSYVVDAQYTPFTMQEALMPLQLYKEAYDKAEERYTDLLKQSKQFEYLSKTLPEGSTARQIYEGYAKDLDENADDLLKHGLTIVNRGNISRMRGRYEGEIGRLVKADEALLKELETRRDEYSKDNTILRANDNLTIDDFLDRKKPNLYQISGNTLYAAGAEAAKAESSRMYGAKDMGAILKDMYRDWTTTMGTDKASIDAFRQNVDAIPAFRDSIDRILKQYGVVGNLTGINYDRARESVINGMINGAVYQENHSPVQDLTKITAVDQARLDIDRAQLALQRDTFNWNKTHSGGSNGGGGSDGYALPKGYKIFNGDVVTQMMSNAGRVVDSAGKGGTKITSSKSSPIATLRTGNAGIIPVFNTLGQDITNQCYDAYLMPMKEDDGPRYFYAKLKRGNGRQYIQSPDGKLIMISGPSQSSQSSTNQTTQGSVSMPANATRS